MKVDYDDRQHRTYAAAREHPEATRALWAAVLAKHIPPDPSAHILDLGCGTGRFSPILAELSGGSVLGVEPSEKMLRQAIEQQPHARVGYIAGSAERIPADGRAFDCAFLSMVVHHFSDLPAAARELARVLKPEARVLIRNCFSGRLESVECYKWLPEARAIDEQRLPRIDALCATFAKAGFEQAALETVRQVVDPNLMAHCRRLRKRAVSTFELMSEHEVDAGLERMCRAAEAETEQRPVREDIDLLVLHRVG